jgi:hypothetical protein
MAEPATFAAGVPSSEAPPTAAVPGGRRVLIPVLLLVNAAAIWGQAGWALDHIVPAGWDWRAGLALSLAFAAAIELIGVYLADAADQLDALGLPAGGVRLGSYAVGLVSGGLNFTHWAGNLSAAVAFGLLSAVSPFLWGIAARIRRGRPVAPSRRFWHPKRSYELIRFMAWEGIADESDAIRAMAFRDGPEEAPVSPGTGLDRLAIGREAIRIKAAEGISWEKIAARLGVTASYLFQCRQLVAGEAR